MEYIEASSDDEGARARLLDAAKSLVLRGDNGFSVPALCAEAGVDRDAFHAHFSGKTALMAAVMQAPAAVAFAPPAPPAAPPQPVSKAEQTSEPSVSTPDAWLERRLRVFERALNALEAKAEITAHEQARAIALLEERLAAARPSGPASRPEPVPPAVPEAEVAAEPDALPTAPEAVPQASLPSAPQPHRVELAGVAEPPVEPGQVVEVEQALTPPLPSALKEEMAPEAQDEAAQEMVSVLQDAREKARTVVEPEEADLKDGTRTRWLAVAATALVIVFVGVGLLLGKNGSDATARESDGVAHRQVAKTQLHQTMALADAGNPRAQARLALAYLRGQGTAGDANAALLWTMSAARGGNPVAQYLLGALYQQGDHIKADPVAAFTWFSRAAEKGNLKAMHNLAIAYAQGLGTAKDEAKAAEWFTRAAEHGYVDSAFDLGVLYERGEGVKQDLNQAMKWYGVAALAGDQPSKARADFLRGQMNAGDIKLANNAAMAFSPMPALEAANNL